MTTLHRRITVLWWAVSILRRALVWYWVIILERLEMTTIFW